MVIQQHPNSVTILPGLRSLNRKKASELRKQEMEAQQQVRRTTAENVCRKLCERLQVFSTPFIQSSPHQRHFHTTYTVCVCLCVYVFMQLKHTTR